MPLTEMARRLYYLCENKAYACEARRIMDEAVKGNYVLDSYVWNEIGWEESLDVLEPTKELWNAFVRSGCCIRCANPRDEIRIKKPYCKTCYCKTCYEESEKERRTSTRKNELRRALSWLNDIPGKWNYGVPCFYCKRTYIGDDEEYNERFKQFWAPGSNFVNGYVWWFGDKKCCCTVCLDTQLRTRGII